MLDSKMFVKSPLGVMVLVAVGLAVMGCVSTKRSLFAQLQGHDGEAQAPPPEASNKIEDRKSLFVREKLFITTETDVNSISSNLSLPSPNVCLCQRVHTKDSIALC